MANIVQRDSSTTDEKKVHKFLSFIINQEVYAIEILKIREIVEFGDITEVPMMPDFVCGAINLRGRAIPVLDLALRLGKPAFDASRRTCVLVVEMSSGNHSMDVGVIVDAVNRVMDIPSSDMEPPPTFGGKIKSDFITGMGKVDGSFVLVLDVDRVMTFDDLNELASMSSEKEDVPH